MQKKRSKSRDPPRSKKSILQKEYKNKKYIYSEEIRYFLTRVL